MKERMAIFTVVMAAVFLQLIPTSAIAAQNADANDGTAKGEINPRDFAVAPGGGVPVSIPAVNAAGSGNAAILAFNKASGERRSVWFEYRGAMPIPEPQSVAIRYRLELASGEKPRPAIAFSDKAGNCWFKVDAYPCETGKEAAVSLPVTSLRAAGFNSDPAKNACWPEMTRFRFGLVIDAPAAGTLSLLGATFSNHPYTATRPLRVTGDGPGAWSLSHDPAVAAAVTTPNEGPDGRPCMKTEFRFPGGRHMYLIPSVPIPATDLEGFKSLRLTYKATLPKGIAGLLVMLQEDSGCQYMAVPMPPASEEWRTLIIPLKDFKLGDWSRDANNRLDPAQARSIMVGAHGTAAAAGDGAIRVIDVEFLP
ncbi:MAG TPA: hypothetical protein PL033_11585 [Candidatus Brocadiia bacterium]|nr:hypothetical protein [Candidatus Brocadiia bacterium]